MGQSDTVDAITLAVVRGTFVSTVLQMRTTLIRTAYSRVMNDYQDFSCALLSPEGEIVGMSEDFAGHVFAMSMEVSEILQKFGDEIHPEDVIVTNEPYKGGTHLNDVAFYQPFFSDGKLLLFMAVRAHWVDVGGASPGSFSGKDTEIYQEGVVIPPVKLIAKGEVNQPLWDVLFANMRHTDERQGDALAMLDTLRVAETGLSAVCAKYGTEVIQLSRDTFLRGAERVMRRRISELPPGEYYYENYMDHDGISIHPLPIKLKVKIEGDTMTFDFTGSAPQAEGPTNCAPSVTRTGAFVIVKSLLDPESPVNGGSLRPLKFVIPEGSILAAKPPAAVGGVWEVMRNVESVVTGIFAQIMDSPMVADSIGTSNHTFLVGYDKATDRTLLSYEAAFGGIPGTDQNDGATAVIPSDVGDFSPIPRTEVLEQQEPVLVESYSRLLDGEAPGYHRSGFGIDRRMKPLIDGAQLSVEADRAVIPPFGIHGGYSGSVNSFKVIRGGEELEPSPDHPGKIKTFPLRLGDTVVAKATAGGAVGDPLTREPELVKQDLLEGDITPERARDTYGVVIQEGRVDLTRTVELRQQLRAQRHYFTVIATGNDEYDEYGCRLCTMSPKAAADVGVTDGELVEYVAKVGPPLRSWVKVVEELPAEGLPLGPLGRGVIKAQEGEHVELRVVSRHVTNAANRK